MSIFIDVLQVVTALLYVMSGVMKTFMFDKASEGVRSFDALPKTVWQALGVLELICVAGLVASLVINHITILTIIAAIVLALESLIFVYVHFKYREQSALILSAGLGAIMLFIAIGRIALN